MKSATVRELKNKTSELLRRAAREDVMITSRGRPVACLVGLNADDIQVRPRSGGVGDFDEKKRQKMFRLLDRIWKVKPDKGKQWVSQEHHDAVLYGEPAE
jgi:prevent-host-death family protein